MTVAGLTETIYEECVADGSTDYAETILAQARAALSAGNGTVGAVSNGSVNGKSFSINVQLSPAETLQACRKAINMFNGTDSAQVVQVDWSGSLGGGACRPLGGCR